MLDKISMESVFSWWAPHNLKRINCIILKVKSKHLLKTHKFGINVPKNMKQEIEFDGENNNTLWWKAVCKYMKNVRSKSYP